MSTIFHGVTDALIIAPGEQVITANSGLTTLTRTYQCAATYEATAESILVPGYAPADYPLLALQTAPVAQRTGSVTVYACTFYGVLSASVWEQYYDQYSTRNEQASYAYEDYTGVVPYGGSSSTSISTIQRSGKFGYGAPVISRSYVVPRATMPKVPSLPSSAWAGFPVSVFSQQPPVSTIPTTLQSGYDHTQPTGADLLTLGYFTRVNSFTVTPYGAANLVVVEYERVWKADGKTINPYAHDPSVLRLSEVDSLVSPSNVGGDPNASLCSALNATVMGFSVSTSGSLATISFSGVTNGDPFPIVNTAVWWKLSASDTVWGGLSASGTLIGNAFGSQTPGSYPITLSGDAGDYLLGVAVQKESGYPTPLSSQPTLA
jgi:hypothetical protein